MRSWKPAFCPVSFISEGVVLLVDWYVELRSATWAFEWLEVTLRRQGCERLLLAGQVADRARKRFVRPHPVPPVDEPLNIDWQRVVCFEVVEKGMEQSGALH
jgi:hypothetical protein